MLGTPAFLAPLLGHLADRVSRRKILAWSNAIMVPVLGSMLLVDSPGDVWILHATLFAYGTMNYLTAAAQGGLLRDLLDDARLPAGNGVLATIDQALRLLAPLGGTALYVAFGPEVVVIMTMLLFAIAVPLFLRINVEEAKDPALQRGNYRTELFAGFHHLFVTSPLGLATAVIAVGFGAAGLVNVAVFPILEFGIGLPTAMLGVIVPLQGIGAVVGGLTAARVIRARGELATIIIGMALLSVALIPAAATQSAALVIAGISVLGCAVSWVVVGYMTMRQRLTPPHLQGRTSAAANVAINVPQLFGTVSATALVGLIDYRILVWGTVALCAVAAGAGVMGMLRGRTTRQQHQTMNPPQTSTQESKSHLSEHESQPVLAQPHLDEHPHHQ